MEAADWAAPLALNSFSLSYSHTPWKIYVYILSQMY